MGRYMALECTKVRQAKNEMVDDVTTTNKQVGQTFTIIRLISCSLGKNNSSVLGKYRIYLVKSDLAPKPNKKADVDEEGEIWNLKKRRQEETCSGISVRTVPMTVPKISNAVPSVSLQWRGTNIL